MVKPRPALSRDDIRARIREAGLRCTEARVLVMEQVLNADRPLTHAEVAEALNAKHFDRATIYRNLIELSAAELLSRIELGDHVWRFEKRQPGQQEVIDHPHFVCIDCGVIACLPRLTVSIKPSPGTKQSAMGEVTEILLKGRCGQCV